jgi:antitoxin YefM
VLCLTRILVQPIIVVMKTMSLAAAKTRFSALVEEAVATHEQIVVTRNGEPAVVVLAVEDFESLLETLAILQDPADRAEFEQARREADEGDVIGEEEMAALMRERLGRGAAE